MRPANAVLTAVLMPVTWTEPVPLAVPSTEVRPTVVARVSWPWDTSRLTLMVDGSASGSVTEMAGTARSVSSATVVVPGTPLLTGGSSTAVMVIPRVAVVLVAPALSCTENEIVRLSDWGASLPLT